MLLNEELVTDRTAEDVAQRTRKGFYMSGDLNRVGMAMNAIAKFAGLDIHAITNWNPMALRFKWRMDDLLGGLVRLRNGFSVKASTPPLPESMAFLDFEGANAIEKMLVDMDAISEVIPDSYRYCGTMSSGEEIL